MPIRSATQDDVTAICQFGADHIRSHYAPLIGDAAAEAQVRDWWNEPRISAAVGSGLVVVAEEDGVVIGVGERGSYNYRDVIWKLYVHPDRRGRGLGPELIAALVDQLPAHADRIFIEHVAANQRAGAFYEREGFRVDRVEPNSNGVRALDVVWRVRSLPVGDAERPSAF